MAKSIQSAEFLRNPTLLAWRNHQRTASRSGTIRHGAGRKFRVDTIADHSRVEKRSRRFLATRRNEGEERQGREDRSMRRSSARFEEYSGLSDFGFGVTFSLPKSNFAFLPSSHDLSPSARWLPLDPDTLGRTPLGCCPRSPPTPPSPKTRRIQIRSLSPTRREVSRRLPRSAGTSTPSLVAVREI